jgi:hypothetical protein
LPSRILLASSRDGRAEAGQASATMIRAIAARDKVRRTVFSWWFSGLDDSDAAVLSR